MKIGDIAVFLSQLLDLPFPFANFGMAHPMFSPNDNIPLMH
jgi:hypothetical protein